eukprot:3936491-Rhodomonas_salina.8
MLSQYRTAHSTRTAHARSVPDIAYDRQPHAPSQYWTSHSECVGPYHHPLGLYRTSYRDRVGCYLLVGLGGGVAGASRGELVGPYTRSVPDIA